jgi:hypothetical protein
VTANSDEGPTWAARFVRHFSSIALTVILSDKVSAITRFDASLMAHHSHPEREASSGITRVGFLGLQEDDLGLQADHLGEQCLLVVGERTASLALSVEVQLQRTRIR